MHISCRLSAHSIERGPGHVVPGPVARCGLEVKSDLSRQCARRDVVRAAEGRKEVVECVLVGQVDRCELETDLVLVAAEQVVMSDGNVEKASRRDTRWVLVVVLRVRLGHI